MLYSNTAKVMKWWTEITEILAQFKIKGTRLPSQRKQKEKLTKL